MGLWAHNTVVRQHAPLTVRLCRGFGVDIGSKFKKGSQFSALAGATTLRWVALGAVVAWLKTKRVR
jgi:hypothetical protein